MVDTLVRAAADDARASLGAHPSPEQLVAYHAGELDAATCESMQDHLALCHECAAVVLAADEFLEGDDAPADAGSAAAGEGVTPMPSAKGVRLWTYSGWAVAATVVIAMGVLGRFSPTPTTPRAEANVVVRALTPLDLERERGEATPETTDRDASVVLILGVPDALRTPARVEFVAEGARDKPVLTVPDLVPNAEGSLTLFVPKSRLPAGAYVVRLFGAAASDKPVAEYALRLSPP